MKPFFREFSGAGIATVVTLLAFEFKPSLTAVVLLILVVMTIVIEGTRSRIKHRGAGEGPSRWS